MAMMLVRAALVTVRMAVLRVRPHRTAQLAVKVIMRVRVVVTCLGLLALLVAHHKLVSD